MRRESGGEDAQPRSLKSGEGATIPGFRCVGRGAPSMDSVGSRVRRAVSGLGRGCPDRVGVSRGTTAVSRWRPGALCRRPAGGPGVPGRTCEGRGERDEKRRRFTWNSSARPWGGGGFPAASRRAFHVERRCGLASSRRKRCAAAWAAGARWRGVLVGARSAVSRGTPGSDPVARRAAPASDVSRGTAGPRLPAGRTPRETVPRETPWGRARRTNVLSST